MGINIVSTGSYTTEDILDNKRLSEMVDTSDEWIIERTGIKTRHISNTHTTEELAVEATKNALKRLEIDIDDIGIVIFASVSSDTKVPASSYTVAGKLGIKDAICFDLNAACSGFVYSMSVASSLLKGSKTKYALVIGAEKLSKYVNWEDRGTCILFGDGAGCAILENTDIIDTDCKKIELLDTFLGGKYDAKKYLTIDSKDSVDDKTNPYISMNGRQIYKFATDIGVKILDQLIDENSVDREDIEMIVPHQANRRIIETLAEKSQIDINKWYMNLEKYGNTSAASVPIALDESLSSFYSGEKTYAGKYIMSLAFGGGLSYGGLLMRVNAQ